MITKCCAYSATVAIVLATVIMWLCVPSDQSLNFLFPNVLILRGFGDEAIPRVTHDNDTVADLEAPVAAGLNGFYQYDPLFYHSTLDRFIKWEDSYKTRVFSCVLFCRPSNSTGKRVRLALVHLDVQEKRHLWYLLEMQEDDANSPVVLARSKARGKATYRVPWVTATAGGDTKPRDLAGVRIITGWDAFRFDTPLKWGVTAAIIAGTAIWWNKCRSSDDDDY